MVLINLSAGQQWRCRPREQTYSVGGKVRQTESSLETYITICKIASGNLLCDKVLLTQQGQLRTEPTLSSELQYLLFKHMRYSSHTIKFALQSVQFNGF